MQAAHPPARTPRTISISKVSDHRSGRMLITALGGIMLYDWAVVIGGGYSYDSTSIRLQFDRATTIRPLLRYDCRPTIFLLLRQ